MKKLMCMLVVLMVPAVGSAAITGNLASWGNPGPMQAEDGNGAGWPIFQGVTLPDPGAGMLWDVTDVTLIVAQNWWFDSGDSATGFEAWLIPHDHTGPSGLSDDEFNNGADPYVDNRANAVAHFMYDHGGQLPDAGASGGALGPAVAIQVTQPVNLDTTMGSVHQLAQAGEYVLQIHPLERDVDGTLGNWPSYLAVGHDGNVNSYAGGWAGYYQGGSDTWGANDGTENPYAPGLYKVNRDLIFELGGQAVVPEPVSLILLSSGMVMLRLKRRMS